MYYTNDQKIYGYDRETWRMNPGPGGGIQSGNYNNYPGPKPCPVNIPQHVWISNPGPGGGIQSAYTPPAMVSNNPGPYGGVR